MNDRRVVITGLGAITPLGASVAAFWDGLITSKSGIRPVTRFDASAFDVRFGGDCIDFDIANFADHRASKRMDRFSQMAFASAKMAIADAHLEIGRFDPLRAGVILGTGIGGIEELEQQHMRLLDKGPGRVSAFTIPKLMSNAASGHISIEFDLRGLSTAVGTACASAGHAMGDAYHAIRRGQVDLMVTGGSEAALTPLGLSAFAAMKALSSRNDDPARASRPFDKSRDGFVLSEGAGVLVFEALEHARARGARIYCELIGFGATSDAGDMVQPDPEGRGAARAMSAALADARLGPDDIDYINAHGTSTPLGDAAETRAIKAVFGAAARRLAVSSTKGATGHLLGASGGIEAIACVKAIENNTLPPTINLEEPDPECDLDYVPNTARDARLRAVMNNSFGFGGHNACLVFRRL
ncbi:MAG: beta-ketoacyl-ACP synthase II [Phycisphaerae bacterium]|nr:beta-ketoacyl-ACP synthase II [Phycisphaerae bacterium]MCZ2398487.1 beta-ketoacyl-ACP synthase II [Phycisphaerae bacterium]NUQ49613.1 beta-ketoacyl-ACP synthase II [Phycisphaerae bacterium]